MARDPLEFKRRLDFCINKFEENEVSYTLCDEEKGHFNIYLKGKVLMSFWSFTGKIYCRTNPTDARGIVNCIKHYKKIKEKGETR